MTEAAPDAESLTHGPRESGSHHPDSQAERNAGSFLVRVWVEEREIEGESPILRGYVRNLRSGEQQYFREGESLGDLVMRHFVDGAKLLGANAPQASKA